MDSDSSGASDTSYSPEPYWRLKRRYEKVLESNSQMVLRLEDAKLTLNKNTQDLKNQNGILMSDNMKLRAQKEYLLRTLGSFKLLSENLTRELDEQWSSLERQKDTLTRFSTQVDAMVINKDNSLRNPAEPENENDSMTVHEEGRERATYSTELYLPAIQEEKSTNYNEGEYGCQDDEGGSSTHQQPAESVSRGKMLVKTKGNVTTTGRTKIGKRQYSGKALGAVEGKLCPQKWKRTYEMSTSIGHECPQAPSAEDDIELDREICTGNQSVEDTCSDDNCRNNSELSNCANDDELRMVTDEGNQFNNLEYGMNNSAHECSQAPKEDAEMSRDKDISSKEGVEMPQGSQDTTNTNNAATNHQEEKVETQQVVTSSSERRPDVNTCTIESKQRDRRLQVIGQRNNSRDEAPGPNLEELLRTVWANAALGRAGWPEDQAEREKPDSTNQSIKNYMVDNNSTTIKDEITAERDEDEILVLISSPCRSIALRDTRLPSIQLPRLSLLPSDGNALRLPVASESQRERCNSNFCTPKVKRRRGRLTRETASLRMECAVFVGDLQAGSQERGPTTRARSKPKRNPVEAVNLQGKTHLNELNPERELKNQRRCGRPHKIVGR